MAKNKYEVRLAFGGVADRGNEKVGLVTASTRVGNKTLNARADGEATALLMLRNRIVDEENIQALKASLPKTVEVTI